MKVGAVFQHTFLTENDGIALVDPAFNAVCFNADGSPNTDPTVTDPVQCGGPKNPGGTANAAFNPVLACVDLTRPTPSPSDGCPNPTSSQFLFHGYTDVKELALYAQDDMTKGNWSFNCRTARGPVPGHNAFSTARTRAWALPIKVSPSNTILRVSYARVLETPFNENLVIASTGCSIPVIAAIVPPLRRHVRGRADHCGLS